MRAFPAERALCRLRTFAWSAIAAIFAVLPARAQQAPIPLDTVSVTVVSRHGQSLDASTRAVTVVDREALLAAPATTLLEALEYGFGIELMPRSPALSDVGIRGSSFEQVLILVDGVRMRDAQTGHFNLNLAVPLDQVERVEILRGPGASLYGSDAMGGVVNIVTRQTGEATALTATTGSFSRHSISGSRRQKVGAVVLDAAAGVDRSDGHRAGTDFDMRSGRLAAMLPVAGGNTLTADLGHVARKFGAGGFYGDYPSFETTRTTTGSLAGRFAASVFRIDPSLRIRRSSDDFILYRDEPGRYRNHHSTLHLGGDIVVRAPLAEGADLAAGLHGYRDEVRSETLGDHHEMTSAGSLELSLFRSSGLTGTVGLRADHVPSGSTELNPSASAAWSPDDRLLLRASVGRAFRSPTWTERYYRDPANEGSADLFAERAWSSDVGVEVRPMPLVRLSASAFLRQATDLIDWARPDDGSEAIWRTRNVAEARFRGAEVEAEIADVAGVRLRWNGYWLSVRSSAETGFESKYALRPRVEFASLTADRSFGAVDLMLRVARDRRSGEEAFITLDGRGSVQIRDLRVFIDVRNASDTRYLDISQIPAAGRNVTIGLELRPL